MPQSTFRCIAPGGSSLGAAAKVEGRVRTGKPRPGKRKIGVKLHRSLIETSGFPYQVGRVGEIAACFKSQAAQIRIVSLRIVCWINCQRLLLATGELRPQRLCDSFGDLALNPKDVSQLAIVGIGPQVGIGLRVNQLHIDPDLVGRSLYTTLQNVGYPKLLRDLGEIARLTFIALRGSARNDF